MGVLLLASGLGACGGDGNADSASDGSGQASATWARQPGNPADVPLLVGREVGALEKQGLTFDEMSINGGNANQIAAVVSGNADFYIGTVDAVAQAVQSGQDVRIFCGLIPETPLPLMANPELGLATFEETGDFAETVQQLKGLKIGTPARGSSYELKTMAILGAAGLGVEDVTYVPIGIGPAVPAALKAGQVDALLGYGFLTAQLEAAGLAEVIVDANQEGPDNIRGQQSTVLVSSEKWLSGNAETAAKICDFVEDSNAAMMDPDNAALVKETLIDAAGVPEEGVDTAYEFVSDDYYGSELEREAVNKVIDELVAADVLEAEPTIDYETIVMAE